MNEPIGGVGISRPPGMHSVKIRSVRFTTPVTCRDGDHIEALADGTVWHVHSDGTKTPIPVESDVVPLPPYQLTAADQASIDADVARFNSKIDEQTAQFRKMLLARTLPLPMDEDRARDILGPIVQANGKLERDPARGTLFPMTVDWSAAFSPETVSLRGDFTADQLEAMAWWMRNRK